MRAFFALPIDDAMQTACMSIIHTLKKQKHGDGVTWTTRPKLHITLQFIGQISEAHLALVNEQLPSLLKEVSPFDLQWDRLMSFPRRRPRVIAVEAVAIEPLVTLATLVHDYCTSIGLKLEKRQYRPHLTLGKLRTRHHPNLAECTIQIPSTQYVNHCFLMESIMDDTGSTYRPLQRFNLG